MHAHLLCVDPVFKINSSLISVNQLMILRTTGVPSSTTDNLTDQPNGDYSAGGSIKLMINTSGKITFDPEEKDNAENVPPIYSLVPYGFEVNMQMTCYCYRSITCNLQL